MRFCVPGPGQGLALGADATVWYPAAGRSLIIPAVDTGVISPDPWGIIPVFQNQLVASHCP